MTLRFDSYLDLEVHLINTHIQPVYGHIQELGLPHGELGLTILQLNYQRLYHMILELRYIYMQTIILN